MATILKGNKIIANEDFNIRHQYGVCIITKGLEFTIKEATQFDFETNVNGEDENFFVFLEELPEHIMLTEKTIRNLFHDKTEVSPMTFYDEIDFPINNRIKQWLK